MFSVQEAFWYRQVPRKEMAQFSVHYTCLELPGNQSRKGIDRMPMTHNMANTPTPFDPCSRLVLEWA